MNRLHLVLLALFVALSGCAMHTGVPAGEFDAAIDGAPFDGEAPGDALAEGDAEAGSDDGMEARRAPGLAPGSASAGSALRTAPRAEPITAPASAPTAAVTIAADVTLSGVPKTAPPAAAAASTSMTLIAAPTSALATKPAPAAAVVTPPITMHSPSRGSFDVRVEPTDVCDAWRAARDYPGYGDTRCDVRAALDDLTLVEFAEDWDTTVLLVRATPEGSTQVLRVAFYGDGVNWNERLLGLRFERIGRQSGGDGDRIAIELEIAGDGGSCTEPESYSVRKRLLVVCDADVCTRPIPLSRRDVTTRYPDIDSDQGVNRVTTDFRLQVRMTREGVRVSRQRGRIPREFREFLGRHTLEDLASEA
ncbi:MAG: hypothetical protein DRJ42_15295 [Deltaproteobacteria bacterium]|nr:MAG: hypothetical protein DRJ42_15295 [Deltaproteobacteria bacterium]